MAILERITRNIDNRSWNPGPGYFPVKNRYTAGVAGQRFFEELKENGKIMGTWCKTCQVTYVPGRSYCERCFERLTEGDWVDVGTVGTVFSCTTVHLNRSGERGDSVSLIAAVRIADGLLIHRLGACNSEGVYIGMPVEAELRDREERRGSIEDIRYFKPLQE